MCKKLLYGKMIGVLAVVLVVFMAAGVAETITVSTAEEFVDAIGSDRTILLSDGVYNLSAADQGEFSTDEKYWWEVEDGKQLVLQNVSNLTIKGESPDCRIVAEPRNAYILAFVECTGITLENVTIGHTPEGACMSGVLFFEVCSDIQMKNCHLFGCGATGLWFDSVSDVIMENASIYDCTLEIMEVYGGYNILFKDCIFRDIIADMCAVTISGTENFVIDHCQFINVSSEFFTSYIQNAMFDVDDSSDVVVKNTDFSNNNMVNLDPSGLISFQNNTFSGNLFDGDAYDE